MSTSHEVVVLRVPAVEEEDCVLRAVPQRGHSEVLDADALGKGQYWQQILGGCICRSKVLGPKMLIPSCESLAPRQN